MLVVSWPSNRFLRTQVRWSGIPISLRIFQFTVIHTVKGFSAVNEADVFLKFLSRWKQFLNCFLYDPMYVGHMISGSPAFSKSSLYTCRFPFHILLKPSLKDFEQNLASMWNEHNCVVVWTFFGIAFLWDWNENWPFPVLWSLLSFPNLPAYWVQHFNSIIFLDFQ